MPTVTVAGSSASPTNLSPLVFTAMFDLPVTGLTSSGIVVTNGAVASITGSGTTYTINVDPTTPSPQAGEAVTLQVLAGSAQNASVPGEYNIDSNTASITYDDVPPALSGVSANVASGSVLGTGATLLVTLSFNEPIVVSGIPVLHLNDGQTASYYTYSGNTVTFEQTLLLVPRLTRSITSPRPLPAGQSPMPRGTSQCCRPLVPATHSTPWGFLQTLFRRP